MTTTLGIKQIILKYFLFGLVVIPPSLHMIGLASSYALGIMILSGITLLFQLASRKLRFNWIAVIFACTLAVFVVMHLLLVTLFGSSNNISTTKALFSLSLLIFLIFSVDVSARQALIVPPNKFDRLIRSLGLLLIALGFLSNFYGSIISDLFGFGAPIPPFAEPAQFSLALIPFAIYGFAVRDARSIVALMAFSPFMILEVRSLIFIFILIIMMMLWVPRVAGIIAILVVALGGGYLHAQIESILIVLDLHYYLDRIVFENSQNLSVLVYLQGIDIIKGAVFGETQLGVGFQQLGLNGLAFESTKLIREILTGGDLNTLDGGFVAAKLFGEFGLLAFILIACLIVMIVKSFNQVHKHFHRIHQLSPQILFANCCMMCYVVELFIRGMGYFSIGGSLIIFSLLVLSKQHTIGPKKPAP